MGHRQSWKRVAFLAGGLIACGSSPKTSTGPQVGAQDAGVDVEAAQIQAIAAAINEFGPAVHTCWARAAADDFRVSGQVQISLEILGGGEARAELLSDEVNDKVLSDCLVALWSDYQWPSIFATGDRIQLPPFEFVAPEAQYVVASAHVPVQRSADGDLQSQTILSEANTGNAQALMRLHTLKDGYRFPLRTASVTELLFVISGAGVLEGVGKGQELKPGSAVYVAPARCPGFVTRGPRLWS